MSNIIDIYEFLSNKNIIHSDTVTNYHDGLIVFVENKVDAITYNSVRHFSINNVSMFEIDEKGNYFYEFSIDRYGDIIDNIYFEKSKNLSAQFIYYIGGKRYLPNEIKKFVTCSAPYTEFKVRIVFFEKPTFNDEFKMMMRNYLLNEEHKKILYMHHIKCDDMMYNNGVCGYRLDCNS